MSKVECEHAQTQSEEESPRKRKRAKRKKGAGANSSKASKRAKSLTRCTESSHARSSGVRTQSAFLKSERRNVAPCQRFQGKENASRRDNHQRKKNRRKSLPSNANSKSSKANRASKTRPKYLQNVRSRIKDELQRDRTRNQQVQSRKEAIIRDIARHGLDENEKDGKCDEWKERHQYARKQRIADEASKPGPMSIADAMMHSDIIQAMDPSLGKRPLLVIKDREQAREREKTAKQDSTDALYDRVMNGKGDDGTASVASHLLSDLREWAAGLSSQGTNEMNTVDTDLTDLAF